MMKTLAAAIRIGTLGADASITKPFDTDELPARVRVALRQRIAASASYSVVRLGDLKVDLVARNVHHDGRKIHLTPKEWGLLAELAQRPGRAIPHAQLLRAVWGPAHERDVEYLRVVIRSLRTKLEEDPAAPKLILNEPGVGYRLFVEAT